MSCLFLSSWRPVLTSGLTGGKELVTKLQEDANLLANKTAVAGLADMALLFKYLDIYGVTDRVRINLRAQPPGCSSFSATGLFRPIPRPRIGLLHRPHLRSRHRRLRSSPSSHHVLTPHSRLSTAESEEGYERR